MIKPRTDVEHGADQQLVSLDVESGQDREESVLRAHLFNLPALPVPPRPRQTDQEWGRS